MAFQAKYPTSSFKSFSMKVKCSTCNDVHVAWYCSNSETHFYVVGEKTKQHCAVCAQKARERLPKGARFVPDPFLVEAEVMELLTIEDN